MSPGSRVIRSIPPLMVLTLAATGCVALLLNDGCGPESRLETTMSDLVDHSGNIVGSAHFTMSERRDDENQRSVSLVLMGPRSGPRGGPLRGHVTAVVLSEAAGALRFDLPIGPPTVNGEEIIQPAGIHVGATEYALLRTAAIDGRLRLHVETSPPAPAVRDVSFPPARAGEWKRRVCT